MIKEIRLRNFFSFSDYQIKLEDGVNVLVGINGSGKSNLLKAVTLLKEGVTGVGLKKHIIDALGGFDNIFFKGNHLRKNEPIELEFLFSGKILRKYGFKFFEDVSYTIALSKAPNINNYYVSEKIQTKNGYIYLQFESGEGYLNEREEGGTKASLIKYNDFVESSELALSKVFDTNRYYPLATLRKAISEIIVYTYFDTTASSIIRKPMLPTSEKRLLPDGTNLTQVLNTIKINHKKNYSKIVEMLNEVNPQFKGFDFNFIGGNIELMLEESNLNSSVHVSNISDGTLRYLCLLSVLFNPEKGDLVCIDEPETGLHPDMISNIASAIASAAKSTCIMIPTHSDKLLNYFEVENVRVFEKNSENSSIVLSYNKKEFDGWYESFSLGNMWRNGDIGGNRW